MRIVIEPTANPVYDVNSAANSRKWLVLSCDMTSRVCVLRRASWTPPVAGWRKHSWKLQNSGFVSQSGAPLPMKTPNKTLDSHTEREPVPPAPRRAVIRFVNTNKSVFLARLAVAFNYSVASFPCNSQRGGRVSTVKKWNRVNDSAFPSFLLRQFRITQNL